MERCATVSNPVVLVVEDEPLVRFVLTETLLDDGYQVLEAGNAGEALDQLRSRTDISAVITDVRMPGEMDGIGLARAIATEWPRIRILVVSGYFNQIESPLPPTAAFLRKPYPYSALRSQLTRSGA